MNGVVRTYEYLIPELEKKGHIVKVISPSDFSFTIPMPGYREIKLALLPRRKLSKLMSHYDPDTIHIATEGPLGASAQKICLKNNIPFSTSYHTQFPDYVKKRVEQILPFAATYFYKKAVRKMVHFHNKSTGVLVTTLSIKKQLKSWGVKSKLLPFTRGIDKNIFNIDEQNIPPSFTNLPRPIALYVGRIAIEKSIESFLDMQWRGSKVVIGQGPDQDKLEKKYPEVLFTGKKTATELANHYRASDLFVFPSKTDTFGMVLIEALACGLPIAAYPVPGPIDIINENYLGVLDNDLSNAACRAIKNITTQDHKKKRSDYVSNHYTWEKAAQDFLAACPMTKKEESA